MTRGQYIRYTVFALFGLTLLTILMARIYASTVDANTPQWLRSVMTLGLAVSVNTEVSAPAKGSQLLDLGQLRGFNELAVEGDFAVEIVSSPIYKVSLTPASGEAWNVDVEHQQDGRLRLRAGSGTNGAVLRVEAPALVNIEATGLTQLTLRGWRAPRLSVLLTKVADVRLEESEVGLWVLRSSTPVMIRADKATLSAGIHVQASGQFSLNGPGGEVMNIRGNSQRASMRVNR